MTIGQKRSKMLPTENLLERYKTACEFKQTVNPEKIAECVKSHYYALELTFKGVKMCDSLGDFWAAKEAWVSKEVRAVREAGAARAAKEAWVSKEVRAVWAVRAVKDAWDVREVRA